MGFMPARDGFDKRGASKRKVEGNLFARILSSRQGKKKGCLMIAVSLSRMISLIDYRCDDRKKVGELRGELAEQG
jgi:hypothetical protein